MYIVLNEKPEASARVHAFDQNNKQSNEFAITSSWRKPRSVWRYLSADTGYRGYDQLQKRLHTSKQREGSRAQD